MPFSVNKRREWVQKACLDKMSELTRAPTLKQKYDKLGHLCWALGIQASSFSTRSHVSWKLSKVVKLNRSLDVPDGVFKGSRCPGLSMLRLHQGCGEAAGTIPVLRWVLRALLVVACANFFIQYLFITFTFTYTGEDIMC